MSSRKRLSPAVATLHRGGSATSAGGKPSGVCLIPSGVVLRGCGGLPERAAFPALCLRRFARKSFARKPAWDVRESVSRVIPSAKAIRRRERTPRLSAEIFLGGRGGDEGRGGRTIVDVKLQGKSDSPD